MKPSQLNAHPSAHASPEEIRSALFGNLVVQQSNMALMFLGKTPHPESGQTITDLDAAQMFIDQLEMLENKTKGNLNKQEESLLKQSLMALRMAFVEVIQAGDPPPAGEQPAASTTASQAQPNVEDPAAQKPAEGGPLAEDHESRKKFSKKY